MRRGQQPGMHRTPHTTHGTHSNPRQHAHSPAATPTHRWKREKQKGAAHKAPPHAHTARVVRRVGTPHGGYAHTQEEAQRTQQQKSKVTTKRSDPRTPRGLLVHGKRSQYSSEKSSVALGRRSYSAHTTSCRPGNHRSNSHTRKNKRKEWNNVINHLFLFLFECWQISACVFRFVFSEGKPSCLSRVLGISAGCTISFLL
ncbi:hypothetical protein TCDM_09187 [Trypanosoma cruzi Dm28c]|uniref:Uncharacterized protein n=1 Tax=Trypanosoma cruzi Dm28c TaxID=1416333 RepID=V5B653_TRYCR|nr:hypothetical protein TCDM_09187 [Trypanosoma cruzi Dm28c]